MLELKAKNRSVLGKAVNALRVSGMTPAELYGFEIKNMHLSVAENELNKVYASAGKNTLIELNIENKGKIPVLIADLVVDPLTRKLLSADFRKISLTEKVVVDIPIKLTGEAPATKEGLMVVHVLNSLEIETLPTNIPHEFEVSIESLAKSGDSICVKDIKIPKEVTVKTSDETIIATVTEHKEEKIDTSPIAPEPIATETAAAEEQKEEKE